MTPRSRLRPGATRDEGYSVVEAVIIIPLMMLLVTLIPLQVMYGWFAQEAAQSAARHGVETARRYQGSDIDSRRATDEYLDSVASAFVSDSQVHLHRTGTTVSVRVSAHVVSIVPGFGWRIVAQSSGPAERFVQ